MNKTLLLSVFLVVFSFVKGQTERDSQATYETTERDLKERLRLAESYFQIAKDYRNSINSWRRDTAQSAIEKRELALKTLKIGLGATLQFDSVFLDSVFLDTNNLKNPFNTAPDLEALNSDTIMLVYLANHLNDTHYDPLLLHFKLDPLDSLKGKKFSYQNELISEYNSYQKSFGRRLCRLIQSSLMQRNYHITPSSWERFSASMVDLKNQAQLLDYEIHKKLTNEKSSIQFNPTFNLDYTLSYGSKKEKKNILDPLEQQCAYFVTDVTKSYGVGWYGIFGPVDFGLDVLYTGENGSGLLFHPKIGGGKRALHFAVGGLANTTNGEFELSGTVYYVSKKFMGGVGVTENRIFLSIGVNPDFINGKTK